jgi:hypothetical protein
MLSELVVLFLFIKYAQSQVVDTPSETLILTNNFTIELPSIDTSSAYYTSHIDTDYSFGFSISVDEKCEQITIVLVSQSGDHYFALGIGGNYSVESGNKMNGYAIISKGDSSEDIWEVELSPFSAVVEQASNDLDCDVTTSMGLRTVTCVRDYATGDSKDTLEFSLGSTTLIWAVGTVSSGTVQQHADDSSGTVTINVKGNTCENNIGTTEDPSMTSNSNHIGIFSIFIFCILSVILFVQ